MAQSLGGGGGDGGLNVSGGISLSKESNVPSVTFGIGGFGGAGAISGNVDASHTGTISTSGGWTHGIFAQSIAGGGGNGALNVTGEFNWADSKNSGGKTDLSIVAGLGGHGGAGADAGNVAVTTDGGTITTAGDYSRGIFAQSIGGGGGTGGMNVTGVFAKNSSPVSIGVGGFGGGGGHAGSASVTRGSAASAAGKITTDGTGAIGIEASSIGGGGGDAGMNFQVGISLAGSSSGGGGPAAGVSRAAPEAHRRGRLGLHELRQGPRRARGEIEGGQRGRHRRQQRVGVRRADRHRRRRRRRRQRRRRQRHNRSDDRDEEGSQPRDHGAVHRWWRRQRDAQSRRGLRRQERQEQGLQPRRRRCARQRRRWLRPSR